MGSIGSKNWKKEAGLEENKEKKVSHKCLSHILVMSNKNDFMIIYSISNRKKKKKERKAKMGKKYDSSNKKIRISSKNKAIEINSYFSRKFSLKCKTFRINSPPAILASNT